MKIRKKRNEPIKETQMVSLADIAFLIIFFFMLTSSFMRDRLTVAVPSLPHSDQTETPVSVVLDKDGKIFLNGDVMGTADELKNELKAYLVEKKTSKDSEIRFRCDKDMLAKDYRKVLEAIGDAGGTIAIIHEVKN